MSRHLVLDEGGHGGLHDAEHGILHLHGGFPGHQRRLKLGLQWRTQIIHIEFIFSTKKDRQYLFLRQPGGCIRLSLKRQSPILSPQPATQRQGNKHSLKNSQKLLYVLVLNVSYPYLGWINVYISSIINMLGWLSWFIFVLCLKLCHHFVCEVNE